MSAIRRIGANMVVALIGKIVVAITGLATVAVMTRHLGAENYGIVKIAQTFVLFAAALAHLGIHYIMVREIAVDENNATRLIGSALSLRMAGAAILLAVATAAATLLPWNKTVLIAIMIAAIGMIAYQGNEIINAVLQWRLRQERATIAETVGTLATLCGVLLTVYFDLGVLTMTLVSTVGLAITFLLSWYLADRLIPIRPVVDLQLWRNYARAGLPLGMSWYLAIVTVRGDALLLSFLKPATDVGLYGVASKIYEVSLQLPLIFTGLLMPLFARAAENRTLLREQLTHALHVMVIVGIGIILTLGFFANEIVSLLAGPEFLPVAPAIRITGFSIAIAGYSLVLRCAAIAQAKQKELLIADIFITASALLAYFTLIPYLSFMGASIGTLTAEIIAFVLLLYVVSKGLDNLPWSGLTGRAVVSGAITAAILYLLELSDCPRFLQAIAGAAVYAGMLLATGALSAAMLRTVLASPRQS